MKVPVTYHSRSGNTETQAQAIYHAVPNVTDKAIEPLGDEVDAGGYDRVFVGFPVIGHSVPPQASAFLEGLPEGKTVLGTYGCQGEMPDKVIEGLRGKPEHTGWLLEAKGAVGHLDEADRADAMEFARLMLAKARVA